MPDEDVSSMYDEGSDTEVYTLPLYTFHFKKLDTLLVETTCFDTSYETRLEVLEQLNRYNADGLNYDCAYYLDDTVELSDRIISFQYVKVKNINTMQVRDIFVRATGVPLTNSRELLLEAINRYNKNAIDEIYYLDPVGQ